MARSSIFAPHRWIIGGVVVLLAALTFLFLRGPAFWQRWYYPLEHAEAIHVSADRHEVDPYLLAAIIDAESDWDAASLSSAGAVGLMQILPATAADLRKRGAVGPEYPADELSDPRVNIEYGAAYLRFLVERYHEVEPAVAAYNAGMANVDRWVGRGEDIREAIEFPETRHYVLRVSRARDVYERLYPDAFPEWSDR